MQLKQFKIQFGHRKVPEPTSEEDQAGWYDVFVWYKKQQKKQKEGILRADLDQKLDKLGLDFALKPIHVHVHDQSKQPASKKNKARSFAAVLNHSNCVF